MRAIETEQEVNSTAAGLVPAEFCHGMMQEVYIGSKGDWMDNQKKSSVGYYRVNHILGWK